MNMKEIQDIGKVKGQTDMKDSKKILKKLDEMNDRMDKMNDRMDKMNDRMDKMNERLERVESNTRDIQLTIENEIRPNIRIIAEGHLDLNRKLDESLKINNEKEIMKLHLTSLENEVRRLKEKIGEPA